VQEGMGFIALHSAHGSKIFARLCGTNSWELSWREADDKSIIWVVEPNHPIAKGIDKKIILEKEEMYGEVFHIPKPDEIVFLSWFEGGEVFRSGITYYRGNGRIFYFQPGHESYPTYYNKDIQTVITNAVRWAKNDIKPHYHGWIAPTQPISQK
jgi:trehalose utilization protein